jgi:hypothetical protein
MQCDVMVGWDPYDVTVNASDVMLQSMQSVHASVDGSNQTIGEAKVIALDVTVATIDAIICLMGCDGRSMRFARSNGLRLMR